jgi:DNA-binding transcriptional MerR regulator
MTDTIGEMTGMVNIGQLAKAAGVSCRTIRYYEELGILPEPRRSPGGTRKYPQEYRSYIETALALKDLGFRLEEIKPLARLVLGKVLSPAQRAKAAQLIDGRIGELGEQVAMLHRLRASVERSGQADLAGAAGLRPLPGRRGQVGITVGQDSGKAPGEA